MNDYYDKIVDKQLDRLGRIIPSASSTDRAIRAAKQAILDNCPQADTRGFMGSSIAKLAIAAAIIIAVCLGIILINSGTQPAINKHIADPVIPVNTDSAVANNDEKPNSFQEQLDELKTLYAAGDVEALIAKLADGNIEVSMAAAGWLAKSADERAIEPLRILAAEWLGETENPFQTAIDEINANIKPMESQQEDTQDSQISEDPETTPAEPNSLNAADAKKEYEKPQNIHYIQEEILSDGTYRIGEIWIRLSDGFREQNAERTVIDNGKERMTLDHKEKTSQFEDSWHLSNPLSEHHLFQSVENFRNELPEHIQAEKNFEESTDEITAYDLTVTQQSGKKTVTEHAKVWAYADSLLVAKFERTNPDSDPNLGNFQTHTVNVEYSPIADSVFEMKVPVGYKGLGRKERGTFSGMVIDETGNPVAGAIVYMKASTIYGTKDDQLKTYSDEEGFFSFSMPPNQEGFSDHNPICFRAYLEDDPDRIAWSLLRSDKDREDEKGKFKLAGQIPEHKGNIEICERYGKGGPWCKGASGIILKMEPSGNILGRVKDALGNPVANAKVSVGFDLRNKYGHRSIYGHDLWETMVLTDNEGYYMVSRLPKLWKKVDWNIHTSAGGYNSKSIRRENAGPLSDMQVDFELLLTGITVKGTVTDNYGKLLDGRRIYISAGRGNKSIRGRTGDNGQFEIKDCPIADKLWVTAKLSHNSFPPHERQKCNSHVYYPDILKEIRTEKNTLEYEVDLVAELPELIVEVEVVDSAGRPLPYFPVEIRSSKGSISTEWKRKNLSKRTDVNGCCIIENIPNVEGLEIELFGKNSMPYDGGYDQKIKSLISDLKKEYSQMRFTIIPVKLVEGQKKYKILAVVLTEEEYKQSKNHD